MLRLLSWTSLSSLLLRYFNPDVSDCPADWIPFDEAAGLVAQHDPLGCCMR
jgi:hypothetical protein